MPIDPRPPLDLQVVRELHTLLASGMKDREATAIIHLLQPFMNSPDDGPTLSPTHRDTVEYLCHKVSILKGLNFAKRKGVTTAKTLARSTS